MIQTSFLDDPNLLARKPDVQTSKDAALKALSFKAGHEATIYAAICEAGAHGITINEVSGLTPVQAARRMKSLLDKRLIKRNGEKRRGCCVWTKA